MTRTPLTPVEQQVYHFLLDFLAEHTFQPSVREIAKHCRIPSTKSVADLLASLEKKGYVEREPGRSRGVTIVGFAGRRGHAGPHHAAGAGSRGVRTEDHLTLDRRLVPLDDAFLVRAAGEAAPAHGVRIGDLVLVNPASRAKDGDVVVVRSGGAVARAGDDAPGVRPAPRRSWRGRRDFDLGQGDDYVVLGVLGECSGRQTTDGGRQTADG